MTIELFNFYYRYKWKAQDFAKFQENLIGYVRETNEGFMGAAILSGLTISVQDPTNRVLRVYTGIALSNDGYLNVLEEDVFVALNAGDATNPRKDLIVLRRNIVAVNPIQDPTDPESTVFLNESQGTEVVYLPGTASANPVYASTEVGDVILGGFFIPPNLSTTNSATFFRDQNVADVLSKNSNLQSFQNAFDTRCKVTKTSASTVSVSASIAGQQGWGFSGEGPLHMMYLNGKKLPISYPKSAGDVFQGGVGTIDFITGVIGGNDGKSSSFTPSFATANNWRCATVSMKPNNTIGVTYGSSSTDIKSLLDAITNANSNAGANFSNSDYPLAYVLLYGGTAGSTVKDLFVVDARSSFNIAGYESPSDTIHTVSSANYTIQNSDGYETILVNTGNAQRTITLPDAVANNGRKILIQKIDANDASASVFVVTTSSQTIYPTGAQNRQFYTKGMYIQVQSDGSNWNVIGEGREFSTVDLNGNGPYSAGTVYFMRDHEVITWSWEDLAFSSSSSPEATNVVPIWARASSTNLSTPMVFDSGPKVFLNFFSPNGTSFRPLIYDMTGSLSAQTSFANGCTTMSRTDGT